MLTSEKPAYLAIAYRRLRARLRNFIARTDQSDTWVLRFSDHRIAYIPIPKAANSSIRRALLPLVNVDEAEVRGIQRFDGFDKLRSSAFAATLTDDWYIFTVVRNPYPRFVSAFLDKVVSRPRLFPAFAAVGVRRGDSLEAFADIVEKWPREQLNDHIMPQTMLLSRAQRWPGLQIHRVEDLPEQWPRIGGLISARSGKSIGPLGQSNVRRSGPHWRDCLTPKVRQTIERLYAEDFAAFGYDKEP